MSCSPIFLDAETNGLKPSEVWVVVTMQDNVLLEHYTPESLRKALDNDGLIIGHNLFGYDIPVLKRLWDIDIDSSRVKDTLVMSRLADPQRDKGNSLRSWGERLNFPKGDHSDWSCLSDEMVTYCKRDVELTAAVYTRLLFELRDFGGDSVELEQRVQEITQKQVRNGWKLNVGQAIYLVATLKEKLYDLEDAVHRVFRPLPTFVKEVRPKVKKDGTISVVGLKFLGDQWTSISGDFSRIDYPEFNLGSRQQIGRHLQHFGWKPCQHTEHGQPIVNEKVLMGIQDIPEATYISEYLMVQKRIAQVESWVEAADDDTERVHGQVNTNGAVTGRMTHSKPNVAQVPASRAPYGAECRSCWTVPEGHKLVGFDASGLELRMLAHYMNDEEYTNEVINGDIHTANQKLAGLESRDQAKTFIYALLYGAGDAKLGSVAGGSRATGEGLKKRFMSNLPAFADLKTRVAGEATQGWVRGLDGRRLTIRSEHAALNTVLQSAGAIVMKQALILLDKYAKLWKLDYKIVGNIHDEVQSEVKTKDAEKFGRLAVSCLEAAGLHFKLNCPLAGEYKIGTTWSETH
jgi:DNA polymerase-1|tara:strand:+ start:1454 stop:3175 length:1722 start_codon:yes stop_codon:yes gene_type:complete